jgi:hypothetical protein
MAYQTTNPFIGKVLETFPSMTEAQLDPVTRQRQKALARWDNEGGAGPDGPQKHDPSGDFGNSANSQSDAQIEHLHGRVIALENLMIALLAHAPDGQRDLARASAATISPRLEATPHPATIHAARQMLSMIERAERLRVKSAKRFQARPVGD